MAATIPIPRSLLCQLPRALGPDTRFDGPRRKRCTAFPVLTNHHIASSLLCRRYSNDSVLHESTILLVAQMHRDNGKVK
jgi:hypothetical protein